ncbi:5-bromo-4-chloroindolyl phosphate hydrolysis family protein [Qiania dongpingensis]|uniref:5-bromo-4-chloroindolyl phosphate hydrolysis family protein n=1 Tax=Qiania dongpingensis TaxID=2763669 RepID=A0A7G9G1Q4_9FIRM|nr:5-bromo-4-chloroindolyl phosphate hydrolysis family protein [Qiania dongpingensis]QNM04736.1 5-bromo-4-chloroindolyl phosphate hydrolysis family protein [Qiania dongpingensis]
MNQEWRDLGNDIRNIIQDAVNSQDFRKLNQTIKGAINSAVDGVEKGVSKASCQWNKAREASSTETGAENRSEPYTPADKRTLFSEYSAARARAGGIALTVCGYILGIGTAMAMAVLFMITLAIGGIVGIRIANYCLLPVFIAGAAMVCSGSAKLSMAKRFRRYVERLRGRTYCELKELSEYIGKSKKYVTRDIKKMIEKEWFREGRLDEQETCLIIDNATYLQYKETMRQAEIQREEEEHRPEVSGETEAVIQAGADYLERIRRCNDAIPGEEISEKISRMELVIKRIFDRVERHPENVEDIQKLMEYYLPTTVKLLEAYEELDRQPVQGDNIISSKKEIEETLGTLNIAFEKLLDSMFQDTAWDVSTDISVLKTILAQEGLSEGGFEKRHDTGGERQ